MEIINKKFIYDDLVQNLNEKLNSVQFLISSAIESRDLDVKSSAGDKHETSRAKIQSDIDNYSKQELNIIEKLNNSGLEIIDISLDQMTSFLGNCIQLINSDSSPILIMSSRAFNSISKSQLKKIESHSEIIHSDIKTIENNGGGSARCMIAEIF